MEKDYYKILGISEDADSNMIKSAYRSLAKENHPDVGGDEDYFKEINEAYDTLKNHNKKSEYDYIRQYGAQNPFGKESKPEWSSGFNLDDLFQQFANRSGGRGFQNSRNADFMVRYDIRLEDAFHGNIVNLNVNGDDITIRIPKGIESGTRIRMPGKGQYAHKEHAPGDLYVQVYIARHDTFNRNGFDLSTTVEIPFLDAILGGSAMVEGIDQKMLKLNVPPGTQFGHQLRVMSQGMNSKDGLTRGDLFCKIIYTIPINLTDEQKILLNKFKDTL